MNISIKKTHEKKDKHYSSLARELFVWVITLSLIPLIIVSWINYQQASNGLENAAAEKLEQSSRLTVSFIENWFEYRLMDLNIQAESTENVNLLNSIVTGFKKSGKNISEYVKSYDWTQRVDGVQNNLITLTRRYDYLHDIFLIDLDGNIVFTVLQESDLGTNLITGVHSNTLFSKSVTETLSTGLVGFSDIERYFPSKDTLSAFLTAPLLDEFGRKIGVFAIQLRLNRILDVTHRNISDRTSLTHYIVGEDGKLRSSHKISGIDEGNYVDPEILNRTINTEQVNLWKKEIEESRYLESIMKETGIEKQYRIKKDARTTAFKYKGPDNNYVIGLHNIIALPGGVNWVLLSEIDKDEALVSVKDIRNVSLILLFVSSIFIAFLTVYQARRITKPIVSMLDTSLKVASGKTDEHVIVSAKNEIGQLADAFNVMLDTRKKYEQELEKTAAKTESALLEVTQQKFALDQHSIVAITDVSGNITFANQKFSEISGYDISELIGMNHRILNSGYHDISFFKEMYRTISKGNVWHSEVCNRNKSGKIYWVDTTIVPFMGEDGKPKSYIAIRTDITKRKLDEKELLEAKEMAEAATRQKSEFLANMSHEIRTPMNGVIGMTGLLLDTSLDAKQQGYAETTMHSAEALLSIINDILDFSKIEAGKMELELLPFNLQSLMEDVSELMALKCQEKNIEMLLHFKPDTECFVVGDPGRVRQVLLNLLSNAIKFTEKGSIVLSVESTQAIDGKTIVTVSVEDSGIGIDDDKLDKIFNKFDQEDGTTTRKYGGTGLGLAICRQLCTLMGGDIVVESQKGQGSIFSFTMQLSITNEKSLSSLVLTDTSNLKGLNALIVDDLEIARTILTEQLSSLSLDINTANSGKDALEKLHLAKRENSPFDFVILDFNMPEMDGEMLAAEIKGKKLLENGALVFVTSSPRKGDSNRLKELGFDGYLTKPTRSLEVPQIMSLIWNAKSSGKDIPLVTRHMVQEVSAGTKDKIKLKNTHVLLVEDNPVNQMVATEFLERYGCSVSPAGNGLEAVAEFKSSKFDLIFMDCQMPEMDGYEATGIIREWESQKELIRTPIIAFTANAMQGDKDKCLSAGMDDYISKPVNKKSLEDILVKWLSDKVVAKVFGDGENESIERKPSINKQEVSSNEIIKENQQLDLSVFNVLKDMFGENFIEAVKSHTSSAIENINKIEDAIMIGDANELERAAHSLKGASGQFGAKVLSELAKKMEVFGQNNDIEEAKIILDELKTTREDVEKLMQAELV